MHKTYMYIYIYIYGNFQAISKRKEFQANGISLYSR